MRDKYLTIRVEGGVAKIILDRPPFNTLDIELLDELINRIVALEKDKSIKVVIITGQGRSFSVGADIGNMKDMSQKEAKEFSRKGQETFRAIETMTKPVIAAVNGYALGGGCELALACDWIYAAERESTLFSQPEIKLGIIPGWGGTRRLPRRIGIGRAREMIFTGEIIDAKEAHRIGLVNKIFPDKNFMKEVEKVAKELADLSPLILYQAKVALTCSNYVSERYLFGDCFKTYDQKEGIRAFLRKRKPKFEGR